MSELRQEIRGSLAVQLDSYILQTLLHATTLTKEDILAFINDDVIEPSKYESLAEFYRTWIEPFKHKNENVGRGRTLN